MMNLEHQPEHLLARQLSGADMRQVVEICGYSLTEFATYLGRAHTYVIRDLQRMRISIPSSDLQGLIRMVTRANFDEATRRILGYPPQKYLKGWEMEQVIKRAGVRLQEFTRAIARSDYYVRTTLFGARDIPLRHIDALILHIGLENYKYHLNEIRQQP